MKRIFAAWRMKYIQNTEKESGCVFCNALNKTDGFDNLITYRGENAFVILNKYPYTSGHVMVAPINHIATLEELNAATRNEMMELVTRCMSSLRRAYNPHAFNMGANIGEAAGAGVPGHVHLHIVPRWSGDTNFMSSIAEVRVLPQTLEETYTTLQKHWQ